MTTYETVYLINETSSLISRALFDVITVIFTIVAAGLFGGDRLSRKIDVANFLDRQVRGL